MFETKVPAVGRVGTVRVPLVALTSRRHGTAVAAGVLDLTEAIARATAEPGVGSDEQPDPEAAEEAGLVEALSCFERAKSTAEARQLRTMADLVRRPIFAGCPEHGHDDPQHGIMTAASLVSAQLRISPGHARARVELACELVECLPATLNALSLGRIDGYRARVLAEETRPLADTPNVRTQVETELLVKAEQQTGPQLRAAARKAVLAADPEAAEERHARARAGRRISPPVPEPEGMATSLIRMPAEDLAAFWTAIDAAARRVQAQDPDDPRTLDQLRSDILADVCWSALEVGHLGCCNPRCGHVYLPFGTRHGRSAAVNVTVPISTLIGIDDHPAHLHGYGPITAEVARRIAANGTWRRLLTDPATGALLDYGTTRYGPPADLVAHVNARDRSCRFPTCTHPAETCDFDHTVPASAGGSTSADNGGPLHRRHHIDKTHHGWRLQQPDAGRFTWTFVPTGHTYEVDPEIIGPLLGDAPPMSAEPAAQQAKPDPVQSTESTTAERDPRERPPTDPDPPPF